MVGVPEIVLLTLLLVAAATDLLWGKIYNWLTFPFLLAGVLNKFLYYGAGGGTESLVSIGAALALFLPLYAMRAIAAGDAKLLMAVAAWLDAKTTFEIAVLSILVGAAVGLILLIEKKGLRGSAKSIARNAQSVSPTADSLKMAFGPAFLCAYLIVNIAQTRHWEFL
jgi:prepilin peptidase CpaA